MRLAFDACKTIVAGQTEVNVDAMRAKLIEKGAQQSKPLNRALD